MSSTGTVRSWGERLRAVAVRLAVMGGLAAATWLATATTANADETSARVDVLSPSVVLEQGQRPADAATRADALVEPAATGRGSSARVRSVAPAVTAAPRPQETEQVAGTSEQADPASRRSELRQLVKDLLRLRLTPPATDPAEDPGSGGSGTTKPLPIPDPELPNLLPAGPEDPPLGNHSSGEVSAERPRPLPLPDPGPVVTLPAPDVPPPAEAPVESAAVRHTTVQHVAKAGLARSALSPDGAGDSKKDRVPTLPREDSGPNPVQTGTSPASNGLTEGGPQRTAAGLPATLLPPTPALSVTGVVYGDGVVPVAGFLSRPATSPD
ncbi:hypothetical protein [Allokutzneria oryzae]|uniref:Secreted protein n=1 Tax=Allokutzneria oryzae TaxID=1378989 RepID=A0ABV5ZWA3_9PSEU